MKRLKYEDFVNPLFNTSRIKSRRLDRRKAYEGTTFTNNFVEIGFTYFVASGILTIRNPKNQLLFEGKVETKNEFEKAIKKADKKHQKGK